MVYIKKEPVSQRACTKLCFLNIGTYLRDLDKTCNRIKYEIYSLLILNGLEK